MIDSVNLQIVEREAAVLVRPEKFDDKGQPAGSWSEEELSAQLDALEGKCFFEVSMVIADQRKVFRSCIFKKDDRKFALKTLLERAGELAALHILDFVLLEKKGQPFFNESR